MSVSICVVIATSLKRTSWLINRSLRSVYNQKGIEKSDVQILIVDDNEDACEFVQIEQDVKELRAGFGLKEFEFPTHVIPNSRTRGKSGTGAWNTGIFKACEEDRESYVSILDDDDEYLPDHLQLCLNEAKEHPAAEAVFQELYWQLRDGATLSFPLKAEDLNPEEFYRTNPGIEGSNLFVRAKTLVACGAFDESFESTTDRDLLIRLFRHWQYIFPDSWQSKFRVISTPGVIHHIHSNERVTTNPQRKSAGLDRFYEKYKCDFSERDFQVSLKRASLLFKYAGYKAETGSIAILMALHNNARTVENAIRSVLDQKATKRPLFILVSDDGSTDESLFIVQSLAARYPNIILHTNHFGSAAANRNWLQEQVKKVLPDCALIGRLDADDSLTEPDILQRIESYWEQSKFDVLLMSNHQFKGDSYSGYTNRPDQELLLPDKLLERLKRMSEGEWKAELPSCNVFLRPEIAIPYKEMKSAEDHQNLVDYLLDSDKLKIEIKPDWVYCNYRIDNHLNSSVSKKETKRKARRDLYKYARFRVEEKDRTCKALIILNNWIQGNYHYLGAGFSGVVFHDDQWVYKVHLPLSTNNFNEVDNILYLKEKLDLFRGRKHFYALRELNRVEGIFILVYPFEKSEPVVSVSREDMISFLAEMWSMKIVCRSITKENNFRRVDGVIKLIDYEIESYSDNLFLNTAARAFIQLDSFGMKDVSYLKLKRSTINNFELEELNGFPDFVAEIFQRCAGMNYGKHPESFLMNSTDKADSSRITYDGLNNPSVSLLIKACIQDSPFLYHDVRELVLQLTSGVAFHSRLLLLDLYKERDFIRQFTDQGSREELMTAAEKLVSEGLIDQLLIPPSDAVEIEALNKRWFGIAGAGTHTEKGVPVSSQIFAFENVPGDYCLQMDVDILVGFRRKKFDYLRGMIRALEENPSAVMIGFQIMQPEHLSYQEIMGQDGSIPPDVRCSLIDRKRLLSQLPLPNQYNETGWQLSWYRSLEQKQQEAGCRSLRGGATDAFYIHIQNYRKENRWVWHTIQQAVKKGLSPDSQAGKPEVAGDIFSWCLPKRAESLVLILYVNEKNTDLLRESLHTLIQQDQEEMGLVIINNTGDEHFAEAVCCDDFPLLPRATFINYEQALPYNEAIYRAIHYYLPNPDSFICLMIQGDILLYPSALSECMNRLNIYGADVLIGKEISDRTLPDSGLSRSDFIHPRQNPESLVNGLVFFRKYLFDAISPLEMKSRKEEYSPHLPGYRKITRNYVWFDDPTNISFLVPITELCSNPIRFDHFNILRKRSVTKAQIKTAVDFVKNKTAKTEGAFQKDRKTFTPNLDKIELDITYDCNLKCFHCNRSCTQAPTDAHMTLERIKEFIQESIALGKKWELINVLGGEPTLHPQFNEIVSALLYKYVIPHSPETTLQITSNGYGDEVLKKLAGLPEHPNLIVNTNSFKTDRDIPYFTPFNMAPVDDEESSDAEFHKGCWVTSYCGIGLNHLGYFACGVAGGIERILKSGGGIQNLAELESQLKHQLENYCRLCGNFSAYASNRGDFMERAEKDCAPKSAMSETWKKLYKQYNGS